mmetsp:Transcript_28716/g.91504  ORF Transcript_28716/g.91504 Transcript_28716/m.91504 type:complete len:212 (+) Transcript_28716:66-701(+)
MVPHSLAKIGNMDPTRRCSPFNWHPPAPQLGRKLSYGALCPLPVSLATRVAKRGPAAMASTLCLYCTEHQRVRGPSSPSLASASRTTAGPLSATKTGAAPAASCSPSMAEAPGSSKPAEKATIAASLRAANWVTSPERRCPSAAMRVMGGQLSSLSLSALVLAPLSEAAPSKAVVQPAAAAAAGELVCTPPTGSTAIVDAADWAPGLRKRC